jgi:hypothetical protein
MIKRCCKAETTLSFLSYTIKSLSPSTRQPPPNPLPPPLSPALSFLFSSSLAPAFMCIVKELEKEKRKGAYNGYTNAGEGSCG